MTNLQFYEVTRLSPKSKITVIVFETEKKNAYGLFRTETFEYRNTYSLEFGVILDPLLIMISILEKILKIEDII